MLGSMLHITLLLSLQSADLQHYRAKSRAGASKSSAGDSKRIMQQMQ